MHRSSRFCAGMPGGFPVLRFRRRRGCLFTALIPEESPAFSQFPVAGNHAGPAVHAGDVAFIHARKHVHEAGLLASLAVGAFFSARWIHSYSQGDGAGPPKEHLHQSGGTYVLAERVPYEDRCDQHIEGNPDNARLDTEGEVPVHDLAPYGPGGNQVAGKRDPAEQRQYQQAQECDKDIDQLIFARLVRVIGPLREKASPADKFQGQVVCHLKERTFRAEPPAKKPAGENAEKREDCKNNDPGKDRL